MITIKKCVQKTSLGFSELKLKNKALKYKNNNNLTFRGLINIILPRFTGTICRRFCFLGCFTKIFVVKKP